MNKEAAIKGIIKELERQRLELENGLKSAKRDAKESPSAMESHSDTTRNQMQTLAANIERTIKEKEMAILSLNKFLNSSEKQSDTAKEFALVEIENESGEKRFYAIVPEGGAGATIDEGGVPITSITLKTPLGIALTNKKIGETAIIQNKSGNRTIKILNIL